MERRLEKVGDLGDLGSHFELVWKKRNKMLMPDGGGHPLNLGRASLIKVFRTIDRVCRDCENVTLVVLGMGDRLVPLLAKQFPFQGLKGIRHVGGVELNAYDGLLALYQQSFLPYSYSDPTQLAWGRDIESFDNIASIVPISASGRDGTYVCYGFDDSIPRSARKHWYGMIERESRVAMVLTCHHPSLRLALELPSFTLRDSFIVRAVGGRTCRTMRVLVRFQ